MSISTERIPKSAARVLGAARIRAEYRQKRRARMQMEGGAADDNANANDDHGHTGGAPKPPPHKKRRKDAGARAGAEKCTVLKTKGKEEHHRLVDSQAIEIQPGESLKHFNRYVDVRSFSPLSNVKWPLACFFFRRVEDHMRPLVHSAIRASAATERKERKTTAATSKNVSNKFQQPLSSSDIRKNPKASGKDAPSTTARRGNDDDHDGDHRPKEFAVVSSAAPRRLNDIAMAPPELKKFPRGVKKHNSPAGAGAGTGVLSMSQRVMMEAERESAIKRYREMKERKTKEADRTLLTV